MSSKFNDTEKRAHHNALERKRRDRMKESFNVLKSTIYIPSDQKLSRKQILLETASFIAKNTMKHRRAEKENDQLKRKIEEMKMEVRKFEEHQISAETTNLSLDNHMSCCAVENHSSESEFDNDTSDDPDWKMETKTKN